MDEPRNPRQSAALEPIEPATRNDLETFSPQTGNIAQARLDNFRLLNSDSAFAMVASPVWPEGCNLKELSGAMFSVRILGYDAAEHTRSVLTGGRKTCSEPAPSQAMKFAP